MQKIQVDTSLHTLYYLFIITTMQLQANVHSYEGDAHAGWSVHI